MTDFKDVTNTVKAAGGGGGCFPKGVQINTPQGYRSVEDIKVGDQVYAFDISSLEPQTYNLPGKVVISTVTQTFIHSFGEVGYKSPLLIITHEQGVMNVTGNHYILTPSRKSKYKECDPMFARASELKVGDILFTEYGEETKITSIVNGEEYDFVYNFEVDKYHAYVADKIRVHNGGGGDKGGGSSRPPVQAPNTVRTNQVARVLLCPSEGEVGGLYDGTNLAKSVYFDGTPVQNPDGSFNFTNVTVQERVGLPTQSYIPGFSNTEAEFVVGQNVVQGVPIIRTVTDPDIDAVRVTIEFVGGLQLVDSTTGDANGTSVQLQLSVREAAGTWITISSPTVSEMSSGPFQVAYVVENPVPGNLWEFRVERLTANSSSNYRVDIFALKSYTEIEYTKIAYNNRAVIALAVGANSTNNKIPNIALDMAGVRVKIPENYNHVTRAYSDPWSGVFGLSQTTDNPAWCLYDMLTNDRYGLGTKLDENMIDKFSFYDAAKYCDELVPDGSGLGTFEPRFTFSAQFMVREDAWKACQAVAATFNSILYMHNGMIRIAQDRPASASRLISNSNVENGMFSYSSTSASERYTSCNVTFNDPADNFLPKTVTETDSVGMLRYGFQSTDLIAYGATTEGQARRAAKWLLYTALNTTSVVEFTIGAANADFEPHEVFKLMDTDWAQVTQEGRIVSTTGTSITLDKPVTIGTGTWTIDLLGADGNTVESKTITNPAGTTSTITLSSASTCIAGAPFIITGAVSPRLYRIVSLTEAEIGKYRVRAVQYEPTKYAAIETGIVIPPAQYFGLPNLSRVDAPTNLVFAPMATITPEGQIIRKLAVSWTAPADGTAIGYQVSYRKDLQPFEAFNTTIPYALVDVSVTGGYEFYINAINSAQVLSPTLYGVYNLNLVQGDGSPLDAPTNLRTPTGTLLFNGMSLELLWDGPTPPFGTIIKDYQVTIRESAVSPVLRVAYPTSTTFKYTPEMNLEDGGRLKPTLFVEVRARDTNNKLSPPVQQLFGSTTSSNVFGLTVKGKVAATTFDTRDLEVSWDALSALGGSFVSDPSFGYFLVEVFSGVTPVRTEQVIVTEYSYSFAKNESDNGVDTPINPIKIRVTPVSKYGVLGGPQTVTFTAIDPPVVSNLVVVHTTGSEFFGPDLEVVWECMSSNLTEYQNAETFKHFKVEVNGLIARTEYLASAGYAYTIAKNSDDNGVAVRTVGITVRAVSIYNTIGDLDTDTFTNLASAVPSNIQVLGGLGSIKVSFDLPEEPDYLGAYIWGSTTSGFTPSSANLLASISGSYVSLSGLPNNVTYYLRIAAFDTFDRPLDGTGLNISAQSTASTAPAPGIPSYASDPLTGTEGDVYFNTTDGQLYRYHLGAWTTVVEAVDITGEITSTQIANNAITTNKINANAITASKIAANAITSNEIAANTILAGNIAASTITGDKIAATTVTAANIVANTITGDKIAAGTISANKLIAGTITAASAVIGNAAIDTLQIKNGSVTSFSTFKNTATFNSVIGAAAQDLPGTVSTTNIISMGTNIYTPTPAGITGPFTGVLLLAANVTRSSTVGVGTEVTFNVSYYTALNVLIETVNYRVATAQVGTNSVPLQLIIPVSLPPGARTSIGNVTMKCSNLLTGIVQYQTITMGPVFGYQLLNLR